MSAETLTSSEERTIAATGDPNARARMTNVLVHQLNLATPLLFFDKADVDSALDRFRRHMPEVRLFYTLKANPSPALLSHLASHRVGFDVSSPDEIRVVRDMGVLSSDIFLSTPIKGATTISAFLTEGVHGFAFDTESELDKVAAVLHHRGMRNYPMAVVRIQVDGGKMELDMNRKFGCAPSQAPLLLQKAASLGFSQLGICFHLGVQCASPQNYASAIRTAIQVARIAERQHGVSCSTINIGGGFCDAQRAAENGIDLERFYADVGEACRLAVNEGFRVYAEPGRSLAAGGTLVTTVIGRSSRGGRNWVYLDDGIYGCYSIKLHEQPRFQFQRISPFGTVEENEGEKLSEFTVAGPSCDALDVIAESALLPDDIAIGDLVISPWLGAYTLSTASKFNGFMPPRCYVVDKTIGTNGQREPVQRRLANV